MSCPVNTSSYSNNNDSQNSQQQATAQQNQVSPSISDLISSITSITGFDKENACTMTHRHMSDLLDFFNQHKITAESDRSIKVMLQLTWTKLTEEKCRDYVAKRIVLGRLKSVQQTDAAIRYCCSKVPSSEPDSTYDADFDKACGVGAQVSNEQVEKEVVEFLHKQEPKSVKASWEKAGSGPFLGLLKRVESLRWADFSYVKTVVEVEVPKIVATTVPDEESSAAQSKEKKSNNDDADAQAKSSPPLWYPHSSSSSILLNQDEEKLPGYLVVSSPILIPSSSAAPSSSSSCKMKLCRPTNNKFTLSTEFFNNNNNNNNVKFGDWILFSVEEEKGSQQVKFDSKDPEKVFAQRSNRNLKIGFVTICEVIEHGLLAEIDCESKIIPSSLSIVDQSWIPVLVTLKLNNNNNNNNNSASFSSSIVEIEPYQTHDLVVRFEWNESNNNNTPKINPLLVYQVGEESVAEILASRKVTNFDASTIDECAKTLASSEKKQHAIVPFDELAKVNLNELSNSSSVSKNKLLCLGTSSDAASMFCDAGKTYSSSSSLVNQKDFGSIINFLNILIENIVNETPNNFDEDFIVRTRNNRLTSIAHYVLLLVRRIIQSSSSETILKTISCSRNLIFVFMNTVNHHIHHPKTDSQLYLDYLLTSDLIETHSVIRSPKLTGDQQKVKSEFVLKLLEAKKSTSSSLSTNEITKKESRILQLASAVSRNTTPEPPTKEYLEDLIDSFTKNPEENSQLIILEISQSTTFTKIIESLSRTEVSQFLSKQDLSPREKYQHLYSSIVSVIRRIDAVRGDLDTVSLRKLFVSLLLEVFKLRRSVVMDDPKEPIEKDFGDVIALIGDPEQQSSQNEIFPLLLKEKFQLCDNKSLEQTELESFADVLIVLLQHAHESQLAADESWEQIIVKCLSCLSCTDFTRLCGYVFASGQNKNNSEADVLMSICSDALAAIKNERKMLSNNKFLICSSPSAINDFSCDVSVLVEVVATWKE